MPILPLLRHRLKGMRPNRFILRAYPKRILTLAPRQNNNGSMMAQVSPRVYAALCLLALSSAGRADSTYPVSINLYTCPINAAGCTPPGTLTVNGIVYNAST